MHTGWLLGHCSGALEITAVSSDAAAMTQPHRRRCSLNDPGQVANSKDHHPGNTAFKYQQMSLELPCREVPCNTADSCALVKAGNQALAHGQPAAPLEGSGTDDIARKPGPTRSSKQQVRNGSGGESIEHWLCPVIRGVHS